MSYSFSFNQDDLQEVCKDRPLVTSEIHSANDFYGQATVIKQYLGLPEFYSFKFVLEHSLFLDDWVWDEDVNVKFPIILSSSQHRTKIHKRLTKKTSIPIGYGFLYAIENFKRTHKSDANNFERRGTIVFPTHSTHHIKASFDYDDYANMVKMLPDKYKPIVICLYWKDFFHGAHKYYQDRGFTVVSAGHIYDPLFMYRFFDICRQFKYSTSNDIGGSLFLSVKSGCNYFYTPSQKINHENPAGYHIGGFTEMFNEIKNEFTNLFVRSEEDTVSPEQLGFVDRFLGSADFKNRKQLVKLIIYSEIHDKLLFNRSGNSSLVSQLPPFWHRFVFKAMGYLRMLMSFGIKSLFNRGK